MPSRRYSGRAAGRPSFRRSSDERPAGDEYAARRVPLWRRIYYVRHTPSAQPKVRAMLGGYQRERLERYYARYGHWPSTEASARWVAEGS